MLPVSGRHNVRGCYAHWASDSIGIAVPATAQAELALTAPVDAPAAPADGLEQRAARFAQVQTRPDQGAFRDAVFRACGSRCVISGCAVPETLETAHLLDRYWSQGHNSTTDGLLLRRDLHNLYDCRLLQISEVGRVELSGDAREYYGEFNGKVAASTRHLLST